jgi:hypothetical protein
MMKVEDFNHKKEDGDITSTTCPKAKLFVVDVEKQMSELIMKGEGRSKEWKCAASSCLPSSQS